MNERSLISNLRSRLMLTDDFLSRCGFAETRRINAREKKFSMERLSENGETAFQTLLQIDTFAIGGVGISGSTSKGEEALSILLYEKDSVSALQELANSALPEGGLYGILGLKVLKCECFDEEFEKFINKPELEEREGWGGIKISPGNMCMRVACSVFTEKITEIAEKIKSGEFDSYIERNYIFKNKTDS